MSGNHQCSLRSAGETKFTRQACLLESILSAHLLWSALGQLRLAVRNTEISGSGWALPPSQDLSHLPLFPSHPLQELPFSYNPHHLSERSNHEVTPWGKVSWGWSQHRQGIVLTVRAQFHHDWARQQSEGCDGNRPHQQSSNFQTKAM